jgi:hypothetical protein
VRRGRPIWTAAQRLRHRTHDTMSPHGESSARLSRIAVRLSWRAFIAALVLFVAGLFAIYTTIVGARLAGYGVAVTRGSADEAIPSGSVVVGRWVPPADVRKGQEVIFEERRGSRVDPPRVRRIVGVETKGPHLVARTSDPEHGEAHYVLANPVVDPVLTLPLVGYVLALLLTPLGWFFGFALPAGTLAFIALWHVWKPEDAPEAAASLPDVVYAPPQA